MPPSLYVGLPCVSHPSSAAAGPPGAHCGGHPVLLDLHPLPAVSKRVPLLLAMFDIPLLPAWAAAGWWIDPACRRHACQGLASLLLCSAPVCVRTLALPHPTHPRMHSQGHGTSDAVTRDNECPLNPQPPTLTSAHSQGDGASDAVTRGNDHHLGLPLYASPEAGRTHHAGK